MARTRLLAVRALRLLGLLAACLATVVTSCSDTAPTRRPVVLIGLDGATWDVIDPLIRAGRLPNLARLKRGGAYGPLETLTPTLSPAIWTTIATGYLPQRHGVTAFTVETPATKEIRLVGSTDWRETPVWRVVSDAGRRAGVVNWWATFPAESLHGFVVSDQANLHRRSGLRTVFQLTDPGLDAMGGGAAHPPHLLIKSLDTLGPNVTLPPDARRSVLSPLPGAVQKMLETEPRLVRERPLSMLKFLMLQDHAARVAAKVAVETEGTPDLLMVYLSGTDGAEHRFWNYYEPEKFREPPPAADIAAFRHVIPGYYEFIDSAVGDVLAGTPPDALVIVVSDHGHHSNPDHRRDAPIGEYGRFLAGVHDDGPPGIVLFSGPDVQPGPLGRTGVLDIAPTVLAASGLPPTTDMPGRVISEAFVREARRSLPRGRVGRVWDPGAVRRRSGGPADPEVLEKLRSLGYIR